jgi:hypothetical protein
MSAPYCYHCLERMDMCECEKDCEEIVYGINRVCYLQGYRDAQEGKEPNI